MRSGPTIYCGIESNTIKGEMSCGSIGLNVMRCLHAGKRQLDEIITKYALPSI